MCNYNSRKNNKINYFIKRIEKRSQHTKKTAKNRSKCVRKLRIFITFLRLVVSLNLHFLSLIIVKKENQIILFTL